MRSPFDFEDEFGNERQQWDEWKNWGQKLNQLGSWVGWLVIAVIIGIWLFSGFYQVGPSETGLVKRFGAYIGSSKPGIHWHMPWPVSSVTIVDTKSRRKEEIGFRTISPPPNPQYQEVPEEALMLTGDGNIVWIDTVVQYDVANAKNFAFNVRKPKAVVSNAAEAIIREQVAQRDLDPILTTARDEIAADVQRRLQKQLDQYNTGIDIAAVKLQDVQPPKPVQPAFDDVNSARQDKETFINEAKAYRNDVIPKARGQAEKIVQEAQGYKAQKLNRAKGDVARFENVLQQYKVGDRSVTIERLYIETMEQVVPNMQPLVVSDSISKNGTLNMIDFSRLMELSPAKSSQGKESE